MANKKNVKDNAKELALLVDGLEKDFGKGAVMMGKKNPVAIDVYSTRSLGLDIALGIGGFPRGRVIECIAWESCGKTTLALHTIAECQSKGGIASFIDVEHALDLTYAKALGVDTEKLLISQPDSGEEALEIAERLARSSIVDMVVVDSVSALVPRAEIEGEMGDSNMGGQARLMGQAMRKLTSVVSKNKVCMLFINQKRLKIGMVFGNPEVGSGGNALKFFASIRIEMSRTAPTKDAAGNVLAQPTKVKVIKNKLAPPFKKCQFDIDYGLGISKIGEIIDLGVDSGVLGKSGSWYHYNGTKIGQGRANTKQFLSDNPELAEEIEIKILEAINK